MIANNLEQVHTELRACRLCSEAGYEITPGAIFSGNSGAQVMLIGQAPGVTEAEVKRPFNAGSGRRLFEWLGRAGWEEDDFRTRHYMTAVTKCFPGKSPSGKGDRVPSRAEQALCRPFLDVELALINPRLVIPVGGLAIRLFYPARKSLAQLIGSALYFPPGAGDLKNPYDIHSATRHRHFDDTLPRAGRWLVPLPHPSGANLWLNRPSNQALTEQAVALLADIRREWAL